MPRSYEGLGTRLVAKENKDSCKYDLVDVIRVSTRSESRIRGYRSISGSGTVHSNETKNQLCIIHFPPKLHSW